MIRPVLGDQDILKDSLDLHLESTDYAWYDEHVDLIPYSMIYNCIDTNDGVTAGYIWFNQLEENQRIWPVHMSVVEGYQRRFFCRNMVNTIFATNWALGCDEIIAESDNSELLLRMGGKPDNGGVTLKLPHIWR